jgi:hypothetical protein
MFAALCWRRPAISWLLDTISGLEKADDYRIFRIDNSDVILALGLEMRPGSFRYSYNEILKKQTKIQRPAPAKDIVPQAAANLGAQWRLVGETTWRNSDAAATGLPWSWAATSAIPYGGTALASAMTLSAHAQFRVSASTTWTPALASRWIRIHRSQVGRRPPAKDAFCLARRERRQCQPGLRGGRDLQ